MKIAGIGFRQSASTADLRAALALTGCAQPDALASVTVKANAPQMQQLATEMNLPVIALAEADIQGLETPTQSPRIQARFGTGSLAEATALAAAKQGQPEATVQLLTPRVITDNGLATAAIAQRTTT
ncbi:cobalamin biosynthesis protein [Parasedimentitalea maritima]|uniref:Precorrin methylase n=1 Tax=Parasedimentitalea maritima TaxID=2578117 RepID=A0A6A4RJY5_9RHOB|nr:cobalamin biosynthesis protein [Zongyanglinia marina]KAE9630004.1 precorrin methylase [Zongyanglinia marina]